MVWNDMRAPMVPLRGLIFLCLLHLCVQGIQGVNTAVLVKMIQYFHDNVQPKTQSQTDAQYALAIRVPLDQCTKEESDIQTVFSRYDAQKVKDKLDKGEKCLLNEGEECTPSKNVIATRPDLKTKEHAEHILLYPLCKSPMDELLKKDKIVKDNCVVFFSYYSPCVKTCIQGQNNISKGLSNWINKRKEGMNAFVFQEIWQKDKKKDLQEEFPKINAVVPLYRCKRTSNVMACRKCVENNIVDGFCLPEKQ
ncbi:uncharacterized protein LOC125248696 [Megalobrama amblycephala]|uniref:uncharacterized protein LOC125248696 n=1 Tax=Megalobrama amblycephala TaxID=75352 RepID=UPI0020145C43|nr:uncharacterized protein LOC125248696 [Megalobrama amblycephala]